jgi:hypothetical protein
MSTALNPKPPIADVVDVLLADVAVRIQLSPTNYTLAVERYGSVNQWIEREGSPLQNLVQIFYPQGSMSIGATIASKLETDEFDIDLIAQLDLPRWTAPGEVLDLLYETIRGEKGSRYYSMTIRCTRCVQVRYADDMHLDVTPMVRLDELPERCGFIFHAKENGPHPDDRPVVANPYGFGKWFSEKTPPELNFALAYAEHEAAYERELFLAEAQTEPVPNQTPAHRKSKAVIALQLLKRWRNIRYDQRQGRRPASVLLAKLIADSANRTVTLSEELLFQARQLLAFFGAAEQQRQIVEVRNPACESDVFTDRWPESLHQQNVFVTDLKDLVIKLERLMAGCNLATIREILADLFGERPAREAVTSFNRSTGRAIASGTSFHNPAVGRFDLAASAAIPVTASAAASDVTRATPKHTYFGGGEP